MDNSNMLSNSNLDTSSSSSWSDNSDDCFDPLASDEQKILSTQQVIDMMRGEVEKFCEVTLVSKHAELVFKELTLFSFSFPAFGKQSTIASHTLQMGQ